MESSREPSNGTLTILPPSFPSGLVSSQGNRYPKPLQLATPTDVTMKYYYFPIPQAAIDRNPKIVQSPLWQ